jgi:hypothetical protein
MMSESHALSIEPAAGMHPQRRRFALINVVGGLAVLGSYAWCLGAYPELRSDFWGGVPESLRSLYTVNMLLAATGYFLFTSFVFLRLDPREARVGPFGFGLFTALYAVVLLGSAAWMPLTRVLLESPSPGLWWLVRLDLLAVGAASLGVLFALLWVKPRRAPWTALLGAFFFCLQTALLDALIWPAYFPHP